MKYPAVYIYKRTSDKGEELKHSIRSLINLTDWNGQVFVCGDREDWFNGRVTLVDGFTRSHVKHIDQQNKLRAIVKSQAIPDDFIYLNDDMYVMEPTETVPLYDGYLATTDTKNGWFRAKAATKKYLEEEHGIKDPLNYDIHVPIILNKQKLMRVLDLLDEKPDTRLQPRSIYGNLYGAGGKQYKDRKTRTSKLLKGSLLSTNRFIEQLKEVFSAKSEFEK